MLNKLKCWWSGHDPKIPYNDFVDLPDTYTETIYANCQRCNGLLVVDIEIVHSEVFDKLTWRVRL